MSVQKNLYMSDLMTGLLAALALQKITIISDSNNCIDNAFKNLFPDLEKETKEHNLKICFRIYPHSIYGDSSNVREAINNALKTRLITVDAPDFQNIRLQISCEESLFYLSNLPGSPEMYERLAMKFMDYYRQKH